MRTIRRLLVVLCFVLLVAMATALSFAQEPAAAKVVELTPATTDISVGQKVKFAATVKDAQGQKTNAPATAWFAAPFDLAGVDEFGQCSDRAGILVLVEAAARGREHDDRPAGMAEPLVFHVAAEMVAEALVIGDLHRSGLFRVDEVDCCAQRRTVGRPQLVGVVSHGLAENLLDRLMVDDFVAVGG